MKFGEFLQVMITQILKKKNMLGSHHQRRFQSVKHVKRKKILLLTYDESGAVDRVLQNNFVAA